MAKVKTIENGPERRAYEIEVDFAELQSVLIRPNDKMYLSFKHDDTKEFSFADGVKEVFIRIVEKNER